MRHIICIGIYAICAAFIALSTYYNFNYGLGISTLAAITYTLYGIAEVILGVLIGGADRQGRAAGVFAITLLLSVSMFTAVALKLSEQHKLESAVSDIKGQAARAVQSNAAALSSFKMAQEAYASAKAEYDSFPVGSAAANRRKADVNAALKNMQSAQAAYSKSGETAQVATSSVQSSELEIYRLLAEKVGGEPDSWSAGFFILNAIIIVFGFSAILFVLRHQRPGTAFCVTVSEEGEQAIAEAREYELKLKHAARAAKIIDKANRKLGSVGSVEKMPIPEIKANTHEAKDEPASDSPAREQSVTYEAAAKAAVAIPVDLTPDGMMRCELHVGGARIRGAIVDSGCSMGASIDDKLKHMVSNYLTGHTTVITAAGEVQLPSGEAPLRLSGTKEVTASISLNPSGQTLIGRDLLTKLGANIGTDSLTIKASLAASSDIARKPSKGGRPPLTKEQEEFNLAKRLVKQGKLNATQTSLTGDKAKGQGLRLGRDRAKEFARRLSA